MAAEVLPPPTEDPEVPPPPSVGAVIKRDTKGRFVGKTPWTYKKGNVPWHTGKKGAKPCSEESKEKMRKAKEGFVPWNKGKTDIYSGETLSKMSEAKRGIFNGEDNPNWQGGKSKETHLIRNSPEMVTWRKFVFERDDYTCQECMTYGGDLRAHHIKSFADYPHLRFQTWNGLTLCADCHRRYHGGIG